jgi:hypothetical protein
MNNININEINKIIKKPIKPSNCLKKIEKLNIHPLNNILLKNKIDNLCMTLPKTNIYKEYNNEYIVGIYSYFHLPINIYNFTSIIYNINTIEDLDIWINDNIDNINIKTLDRILYCYSISNIKDIINNIDSFINIIKKILNFVDISYDNNNLDKIILNLVKNKNNLDINYLDNLKKYLK